MIIDLADAGDGRIRVTVTANGSRAEIIRLPARIRIEEETRVHTEIEARILTEEESDDAG